jgi:molybdopterin-binding protein
MRISARNRLPGTILEVTKGQTTAHIRIQLDGGAVVTAAITNEAVDELGLTKGMAAMAIIKASDVMVAIEP